MFEKWDVWKRLESGSIIRFQCLRWGSDGLFAVQNADFFRAPVSSSAVDDSDRRFIELLVDDDPVLRCQWYNSLEEAVDSEQAKFEKMPGKQ